LDILLKSIFLNKIKNECEAIMIRLSQSCLGQEEIDAVTRVLRDGYLGMGQEVRLFEQELQNYISPEVDVVCVNTGTSALQLSVQACGIGAGDEVIIPSLTYVASFQAVSATGAKPVACDIDPTTGCIDVADAKERITPKTKAIMPVHYASGFGNLEGVYEIAHRYGLRVIEDAAHSFGGSYKDKPVGAHGDIICFSFDGIKNITCGEGGAVVSKDKELTAKIQDLRLLGVEKDTIKRYSGQRSWDFQVNQQGWRYHMSNMNAAIGREQLKKIDKFGEIRRSLSEIYQNELSSAPVEFLALNLSKTVPHIFPVLIPRNSRNELKETLFNRGIETGIHYKPNHLLKKFEGTNCLKAEEFWERALTLPLHCNLKSEDVLIISKIVKDFCKNN
jgi:dTDP-4-amino-4,6-dideoxygalactose transaminase